MTESIKRHVLICVIHLDDLQPKILCLLFRKSTYQFLCLNDRLALLPLFVEEKERCGSTHPLDKARSWPQRSDGIVAGYIAPAFVLTAQKSIGDRQKLHDSFV